MNRQPFQSPPQRRVNWHVCIGGIVGIVVVLCNNQLRADWPQFRGRNSSGVTESTSAPIEFGPDKNEHWSVPLDSGHSSPCITGDLIFLTTFNRQASGLAVICLSRVDGSTLWRRAVPTDEIETGHPSFNPASSTPATDGECVVAYFGSFGLICFDRNGQERWRIKMPLTKSYAGNATSPTIVGDRVILYRGNHVDHYLLAVDKRSGERLWQVDQDEPFAHELACTACPIVSDEKLIVHTARSVQAIDLNTGKQIWVAKCATTATSTPVIADDEVIVAAWNKLGEPALRPKFPTFADLIRQHDGDNDQLISSDELPRLMIFHRPDGAEAPQNGAPFRFASADKNNDDEIDAREWAQSVEAIEEWRANYQTHGLLAIKIDSHGALGLDQIRILADQGIPEVPSPLYHNGKVYIVKNGGVLTCIDLATGKRLARMRTRGIGTHYASPIIAGGLLYSTAGNGTVTVLKLGVKPKVLAVNKMNDETYATPAVVDNTLYVRTHSKLYAFRAPHAD